MQCELLLGNLKRPESVEIHKVGLHVDVRYCLLEKFRSTEQFLLLVLCFGPGIDAKSANQPSVSTTI
jgi:hypothetical protein